MLMRLIDAARTLAEAAGWSPPAIAADGVCRYALEDGLDLELSSPDGRTLILAADLGEAPVLKEGNEEAARARLERIGLLSAASMRKRASVLSIHEGRLRLTRTLSLQSAHQGALLAAAEGFLNDQAFWRDALGDGARTSMSSSDSPFSMGSGNWFSGDLSI